MGDAGGSGRRTAETWPAAGHANSGGPEAAARRKNLGAWYTPVALVEHVLDQVLMPTLAGLSPGSTVSILDPACGDGRFLSAARARVERAGLAPMICGVDLDPGAIAHAAATLGPGAEVFVGNALEHPWGSRRFDVILGNPPFLNQLATSTTRGKRSPLGGGPYANAAAEFLALAIGLARPSGGRVGLVLPLSILSTRDAGPIRAEVAAAASLTWCWWSARNVFDAHVRTCALGFVTGPTPVPGAVGWNAVAETDTEVAARPVTAVVAAAASESRGWISQTYGRAFDERPRIAARPDAESWSWLITDQLGIPPLPVLASNGVLGDRAIVTADFRDEYYGLIGAVGDDVEGPPLVTCGMIEPGRNLWGERPTRFAKEGYVAPRVDLGKVGEPIIAWSKQRLVPKVLVANQTRIIEAVADPAGDWLPSVPVVSVIPGEPGQVWEIAALLTSSVASAWIGECSAGAGLSASAMRIAPAVLARLPWPRHSLGAAVEALRSGDLRRCDQLVSEAFALSEAAAEPLHRWWSAALR